MNNAGVNKGLSPDERTPGGAQSRPSGDMTPPSTTQRHHGETIYF